MRVLIISHNSFRATSNMGKTLMSYFQNFTPEELAQFYIHNEEPTEHGFCRRYYRFTDTDALKSLLRFRCFGSPRDEGAEAASAKKSGGWLRKLYQLGEQRTPLTYALRELLWKCSRWDTAAFRDWIAEFDPDVIFFAAGDYCFSYEIAGKIAARLGKPLAVCCMDDFYLYNRNGDSLSGRLVHRYFRRKVEQTMARAGMIFTICTSLAQSYGPVFRKPCRVLHTLAMGEALPEPEVRQGIAYLGKLELQREQQLIAMGRALQRLDLPDGPRFVDVYSGDRDEVIIRKLQAEPGIRFHGAVSAERVQQVMAESLAVIHTESFDEKMQDIVRHSVSAKIPDSLRNGPCIIAYGPEGVASIDYLKAHGAAYVISHPRQLETGLWEILTDGALRETIIANARRLARKNHSPDSPLLRRWLEEICKEQVSHERDTDQLRISAGQHRKADC